MQAPALSREEVDTYLGAVDWLRSILTRTEVAASWGEPGALLHYTVGGIAAHAVHGVIWLEQVLKDAEPLDLRRVAVGEFFGLNRVEGGGDDDPFAVSLRSAAESFAQTGAPLVAAACTRRVTNWSVCSAWRRRRGPFP